ncbi:MAG TPA: FAD-dependent thymidylate synthase, partial [Acidimicrobiales bacterium]|nr:FAD-dependent thymidylate synthase [Acidimicrobiales bacterium]
WVKRVDVEDRGREWSAYLAETHAGMEDLAGSLFGPPPEPAPEVGGDPEVALVDWDPEGEVKVVASMLYPYTHLPETAVQDRVAAMSDAERLAVVDRYVGDRRNRRHKPGRALERTGYRFDVISDYGAFRDLQRHRLLTVELQDLTPAHGYTLPEAVVAAGGAARYHEAMERSAALHGALRDRFGAPQAAYAVALAYRIRYAMQFNAREALHLLELRTGPAGHPEYRKVGQQMHRLIAEQAGHRAVAALMRFVDHADYEHDELPRLAGERRAEARRSALRGS